MSRFAGYPGLAWLESQAGGRAWLQQLPSIVEQCAEQWDLEIGPPLPGGSVSLPLAVTLPGGTEAVLKIQYPHRESEHEAAALARWNGDGAVQLLAHNPIRSALLVERCIPGNHLSELEPEAALDVVIGILPRLWKPASPPFRALADEAADWAAELPRSWEKAARPFERWLLDAALDALKWLPGSQRGAVLLHQDLHADNVLRARREPWLVIDPKPLSGERELGIAPLVRAYELGHERRLVHRRLDRLVSELGLDRERARQWALAQTLAWGFSDDQVVPRHVETAHWLAEAR